MDLERFRALDIILVCGLPGSGKSHFAGANFSGADRLRVNRKELRRLLFEMTHFGQKWSDKEFASSDEFLVSHVERRIIEHFLQNHKKVLVDNTSMSRESRKHYVAMARQAGRTVGAIFLDTPIAKCLERNRAREDAMPERLISNLAAEKELPEAAEGYKEVTIVSSY
jgi:predicted kinase